MKVCVNSQTPFLRFVLNYSELLDKYGQLDDPVELSTLEQGSDYNYSPGGVTAMVYPLLKKMTESGGVESAVWVSLGVNYPPRVKDGNILLSHVELDEGSLKGYTNFKEALWRSLHGLPTGELNAADYQAYTKYNWLNAERLLHYVGAVDVFFIQDFQQLLTGQLIGPSAPAVLRWHVPMQPQFLDPRMRKFILKAMEGFDSVIVSTRRDMEALVSSAYHGHAYQVYPYIDESKWSQPSKNVAQSVRDSLGLKEDETLLLHVARMDPIKSQDVAIRALARIKNRNQKVKLALVGNGSFSSSSRGGLGYGKAKNWRTGLEALCRELGVADSVMFLGYQDDERVKALYSIACAVLLTSKIEGFGITVLEAWQNHKPVIVSSGAGASELVVDGSNGYVFRAGDDLQLAEKIELTLSSDVQKLGDFGYETSRACTLNLSMDRVKTILEETVSSF
ncbi:MAG: glycosyltransferase family 4 protein [Thermoprotei archaeon]